MKGNILWFSEEKGYGFIKPDLGPKDVFVHHSGIAKSEASNKLKKDQRVEFDIVENEKGKVAVEVRVVGEVLKVISIK